MHFGSLKSGQGTVCRYIHMYNNVVLISKVLEEIARENAEKCCCSLTPPLREPPRISAQTVYCQGVESCSDRRMFCAMECVTAVQGHPMSLILAPIESAYATSY